MEASALQEKFTQPPPCPPLSPSQFPPTGAGVQNVIDPFFTALCTNAITSAIGIARILIAAGVLLWIQLAIGVEVCCHHPGHAAAWEPELALRGVVGGADGAAAHSVNAGPHTGGGKHV